MLPLISFETGRRTQTQSSGQLLKLSQQMEVWFFFDEGTTGREPQMSGEETERIYTRAPPKRVGRALALLTKTYHGSRVIGN